MIKPSIKDSGKRSAFGLKLAAFVLTFALLMMTGCGNPAQESPAGVSADGTADDSVSASAAAEDSAKREQLEADKAAGMLILVNKQNPVEQDYVPENLAPIKYYAEGRDASARFMISEAADHFHQLVEAAQNDGVEIVMTTAYRSYSLQSVLWENNVKRKGSEEAANMTSARPNESEHRTGLAVDLSTAEINYEISSGFGETAAGKWIAANAYKYGFILRYPEDKTDITGYSYEPWHIRYVGTTAAKDIYEQGLTLEEYLEQENL